MRTTTTRPWPDYVNITRQNGDQALVNDLAEVLEPDAIDVCGRSWQS